MEGNRVMRRNFSALREQPVVAETGYENITVPYEEAGEPGRVRALIDRLKRPIAGAVLVTTLGGPSLAACGDTPPERRATPAAADSSPASPEPTETFGMTSVKPHLDTDGDGKPEIYETNDKAVEAIEAKLKDSNFEGELVGDRAVLAAKTLFTEVLPLTLNWGANREARMAYDNHGSITTSKGTTEQGAVAGLLAEVAPIYTAGATGKDTEGEEWLTKMIEETGASITRTNLGQESDDIPYRIKVGIDKSRAQLGDSLPGVNLFGGIEETSTWEGAILLKLTDNTEDSHVSSQLPYHRVTIKWGMTLEDGQWKLTHVFEEPYYGE